MGLGGVYWEHWEEEWDGEKWDWEAMGGSGGGVKWDWGALGWG